MIPKAINQIERADIELLISNGVHEGRTLEYKREIPGTADGDKVKFLRAVSGMANTDGGDIIYGIEANDGIASAVRGFSESLADQTKLRLEQLLQTCIEPRIPSVVLHTVPISEENCVLIVRSQRSWLAPHRIAVGSHVHFYGRNSASTFPMDVSQLRNAFLLSDLHADQVRAFVVERLLRIEQGKTPVPLVKGAKVIMHILPLSSLSRRAPYHLDVPKLERTAFPLCISMSRSQKPNLDGFVVFDTRSGDCEYYTQVFRTGAVETVAIFGPTNWQIDALPGSAIEEMFMSVLKSIVEQLVNRNVPPPYIVSLSFAEVTGFELHADRHSQSRPMKYPEPILILPDALIDDPATFRSWEVMRPVFDAMWNAFEYDGSPNFDDAGQWHRR